MFPYIGSQAGSEPGNPHSPFLNQTGLDPEVPVLPGVEGHMREITQAPLGFSQSPDSLPPYRGGSGGGALSVQFHIYK